MSRLSFENQVVPGRKLEVSKCRPLRMLHSPGLAADGNQYFDSKERSLGRSMIRRSRSKSGRSSSGEENFYSQSSVLGGQRIFHSSGRFPKTLIQSSRMSSCVSHQRYKRGSMHTNS